MKIVDSTHVRNILATCHSVDRCFQRVKLVQMTPVRQLLAEKWRDFAHYCFIMWAIAYLIHLTVLVLVSRPGNCTTTVHVDLRAHVLCVTTSCTQSQQAPHQYQEQRVLLLFGPATLHTLMQV